MAFDNVTFFEVHLGEQLDNAVDRRQRDESARRHEVETDSDTDDSGGGLPVMGLLVVAVFVAGLAIAAKKLRGGGADEIETEPIQPGVEVERPQA